MKKTDIISFANELGAYAVEKRFDGVEVVSIFVERANMGNTGIIGWKHGIFISEVKHLWEIGFHQKAKTKLLTDKELLSVLDEWCQRPSNSIFEKYIED